MLLTAAAATPARAVEALGSPMADAIADVYFETGADATLASFDDLRFASGADAVADYEPAGRFWSRSQAGRTLLRVGYSYVRDEFDGLRTEDHITPDLLLSMSLSDRLDLRIGWGGWAVSSVVDEWLAETETSTGVIDPSVGLKARLWDQHGAVPRLHVLASLPIATEGDPFARASLLPTIDALYSWRLTKRLVLAGSTGVVLLDQAGGTETTFQQSIGVDYEVADRLGVTLQTTMLSSDASDEFVATGGFDWTITHGLHVTPFVGVGLNEAAPDLQAGVGFTIVF